MAVTNTLGGRASAVTLASYAPRTIPVFAVGMSLSVFLALSYVICVIGYLAFPGLPIDHAALAIFLPGFELLSWTTFAIGLVESFAYGWYIALIFGPLYNFFATRGR